MHTSNSLSAEACAAPLLSVPGATTFGDSVPTLARPAEAPVLAQAVEFEANETAAYRSLFETAATVHGDRAFRVLSFEGASAFVSPLVRKQGVFNRVLGLGLRGPVQHGSLRGLVELFEKEGCSPAIDLAPQALESVRMDALRTMRMRRSVTAAVLHRRLDAGGTLTESPKPLSLRVDQARGAQCDVVAAICVRVFAVPAAIEPVLAALEDQPGWQHWLATVDGRPAGAALSYTQGPRCWFGWAATLPDCRGLGVKGALDDARIAHAQAAGCSLVTSDTATGTSAAPDHSLRSFLRRGFATAYVRATYLRVPEGGFTASSNARLSPRWA
jgi:GNAT superfamily N-acetyltransferase